MSNAKVVMGQAANTLTTPLNVEDVFSTYLYEGNSSTQTITNGIDLAGEGGLIWTKQRDIDPNNHMLVDTERGLNKWLESNTTDAEGTHQNITSVSSTGYVIPGNTNAINNDAYDFTSWTFRKAPKFFDVVTYTGTGSAQAIAHNLGVEPGCIIVKRLDSAVGWPTYHRSNGNTGLMYLNTTAAVATSASAWGSTNPTDTHFTVGTNVNNISGGSFVAYLFAHNDGDGEFGADSDADIIKCGSYTGNGSSNGPEIDLGFEPQWVMIKRTDSTSSWFMFDNMRGIATGGNDMRLYANASTAEYTTLSYMKLLPNGFAPEDNTAFNASGGSYIYIAIRRGTKVPESGTEVFGIDTYGGTSPNPPAFDLGYPVDFGFYKNKATTGSWSVGSRLMQGGSLSFTSASESSDTNHKFDYQTGWYNDSDAVSNIYSWMWKRAPNFFDAVAYTGTGVARTVSHNLGVAPEMMWVKARNASTYSWIVQGTAIEAGKRLELNENYALTTTFGGVSNFTSTSFDLGNWNNVNGNTTTYIAYLFASLPGISKVGSYTGNGTSQTIDCGFSSGARFILVKRTDSTGDWYVWDTERGIVAGNDPYLELNTTDVEVTSTDWVDPDNSGFIVNGTTINASSASYIFYAIA